MTTGEKLVSISSRLTGSAMQHLLNPAEVIVLVEALVNADVSPDTINCELEEELIACEVSEPLIECDITEETIDCDVSEPLIECEITI